MSDEDERTIENLRRIVGFFEELKDERLASYYRQQIERLEERFELQTDQTEIPKRNRVHEA